MLPAIRAVLPEIVRGLSTSLALVSSRSHCEPKLVCPEHARCPDCVCLGEKRQAIVEEVVKDSSWVWWIVVVVCAYIAGVVSKARYDKAHTAEGRPVIKPEVAPVDQGSSSEGDWEGEAKQQLARKRLNRDKNGEPNQHR